MARGFCCNGLIFLLFSPAVIESSAITLFVGQDQYFCEAGLTLRQIQGHANGSSAASSEREWM